MNQKTSSRHVSEQEQPTLCKTAENGKGNGRRFPLVEVAGTPYAMGKAHGTVLRAKIEYSLEVAKALLPVPFEIAVKYCKRSIPYCREKAPDLMEEVQGIADGAGMGFDEIFTLNASLDLMGSGAHLKTYAGPDCWAMALNGPATGGRTLVAWTAEDSARWFDACILLKVMPEQGFPCLMWTFAGFIGRPGLNPRLALSAACQVDPGCGDGMPYPFICRRALGCATTAEAIRSITECDRMSGMAYAIGDSTGDIVTLKTSARAWRTMDYPAGWTASSGRWAEERLARIEELLREQWGQNGVEEIERIQRDHGPGNLCAHDGSLATLTCFICDVQDRAMWLTWGSPCTEKYLRYEL